MWCWWVLIWVKICVWMEYVSVCLTVLAWEIFGWLSMGWMCSVMRSAQADMSTVAMIKISRALQRDQCTTAPIWPATATHTNHFNNAHALIKPTIYVFGYSFSCWCRWILTTSITNMNVIDVWMSLQSEQKTDDVGHWQQNRHCVHQGSVKQQW